MSKITLTDLVNLQNENTAVTALNNNSAIIEAAIDNTLSRDGSAPNPMLSSLDMNSNRILNLPAPSSNTEPVRLQDVVDGVPLASSFTYTASGTGAVSRTVTSKLSDYLSILDYGASTGSSDNGPAINRAIQAAYAVGGGTVYVPPGVYAYTTQILMNRNGVNLVGSGIGSTLYFTGTASAIGIAYNNGIENVLTANLKLSTSDPSTTIISTKSVNASIVFSNVMFSGGARNVYISSVTPTSGGSYDVHFVDGCVFANAGSIAVTVAPLGIGYAQAIYFKDCFWYGYTQALSITSGSGIFVSHCHIERHLGSTTPAVHVDTSNKIVFRDNYFEDDGNTWVFENGSDINGLVFDSNYVVCNVDGGTKNNSLAMKCTSPVTNLILTNNYLSNGGTVSSIVDLNASTVYARCNTLNGTATYGWASTASAVNVNIDSTSYTGVFGTQQQVASGALNVSTTGNLKGLLSTAIPAGGTAGSGILLSSATNFGIFFGSGAPTLSASQGSLYIRSDGSTTTTRLYVNTNGSTTWTAVTTVA